MDNLIKIGAALAAIIVLADWMGLLGKTIGNGFCSVRHPIEAMAPVRKTGCESQHVIQKRSGGTDEKNTIWINGVEHVYADLSVDRPWEKKRPWSRWLVDDNAERAYMMGVFANGFHFVVYDHHGEGHATITEWDGVSHLTYGVASAFNFISKELTYLGYQVERTLHKKQEARWVDATLGIFVDLAEVAVGMGYCVVGVVVGTLFNPLDTIKNFLGGILLIVESAAMGIYYTVSDIISLFTLGSLQI